MVRPGRERHGMNSVRIQNRMYLTLRTRTVVCVRAAVVAARSSRRACGQFGNSFAEPMRRDGEHNSKDRKLGEVVRRQHACVFALCVRRRRRVFERWSAVWACASPSDACAGGVTLAMTGSGCPRCKDT